MFHRLSALIVAAPDSRKFDLAATDSDTATTKGHRQALRARASTGSTAGVAADAIGTHPKGYYVTVT
jgi:hypothetical protein